MFCDERLGCPKRLGTSGRPLLARQLGLDANVPAQNYLAALQDQSHCVMESFRCLFFCFLPVEKHKILDVAGRLERSSWAVSH